MNFLRRTFFGLPRQALPDTTDSLQSMMFVDEHGEITWELCECAPRDPFMAQEQLAKLEKACVPLMASPNVGLIGPGQDVVFKLILPDRNIWPVSR
uniref:Uncharacterized protein n=1 Tax=Meloidogyne floridensis TaxID=298350 RepID=A0A915P487_9BILA